jgi:hypothetical protein
MNPDRSMAEHAIGYVAADLTGYRRCTYGGVKFSGCCPRHRRISAQQAMSRLSRLMSAADRERHAPLCLLVVSCLQKWHSSLWVLSELQSHEVAACRNNPMLRLRRDQNVDEFNPVLSVLWWPRPFGKSQDYGRIQHIKSGTAIPGTTSQEGTQLHFPTSKCSWTSYCDIINF